nr:unnamed protein product [Callosobruchus analis]
MEQLLHRFLQPELCNKLLLNKGSNFPSHLKSYRDFYVDDLITGSETVESARELKSELVKALTPYGFNLRKWGSNEPRVLEALIENSDHCLYEDEVKRTLGLIWRAYSDELTYSVDQRDITVTKVTKRGLLSAISRIFDPLGLISPVILRFKILLQQLWELKLSWDDNLPDAIANEWKQISADLPTLNDVKINRHVIISNPKYIELHCFSDASQYGYGACVYVKSVNANNEVEIHLICSKSRVAPLKTITIPRLELCGALLATRLHERVKASLLLNIDTSYFWTDSMIVLSWLKMQPSSLKVFVANRVAEIQRHTTVEQWGHVPTSQNPADLASRGSSPSEIRVSNIWWSGPEWLKLSSQFWPKLSSTQPNTIPETKIPKIVLHLSNPQHFDVVDRFSSLYKLQRVIALIHRFCFNCRHSKAKRIVGNISVEEMDLAMKSLIRIAQQQTYNDEIQDIESGKNVSRHSKLLTLNPVIDEHGLLRVGGRLINSKLPYASKHQIILAPKHPLTRLIIITEHYRNMHAGILQLLGSLRKTYWIVHGRRAIRSILRSCIICYRANPKTIKCKMGDLPEDRVKPCRPFSATGIDLAGPFHIKDGKIHNRAIIKAYLCIFICFATKAVHLEVISDLSSGAFFNALTRFVSRRGLCSTIYSDNGTNFVGTNNDLKLLYSKLPDYVNSGHILDFLLKNSIKWNFIHLVLPTMVVCGKLPLSVPNFI